VPRAYDAPMGPPISGHMSTYVPTSRLLTVDETAARLCVSSKTVRRKISSGELPAIRLSSVGRGAVRVDESDLDAWLYANPKERP
jgi:excisionase family DNA binding protein